MTPAANPNGSCPVCGQLGKYAYSAKGFKFSKCLRKECGHVFVDPMPNSDELNIHYAKDTPGLENSDSWTLAVDYANDPQLVHRFYERNRIRFLKRKGYLGPTTEVLDVGCSTGMFLRVLKDQGIAKVAGVDISLEQITHCRQVNKILAYQNLNEIPVDQSFDLICLYAVLEHVPNPVEVLQQCRQRLNIDGNIIIDVPNYASLYRFVSRKKWLWLIPPVHLQYFTPKSIAELAFKCDLQISYSSTRSTSTLIYILTHHVFDALNKEMPSTSLSASRLRTLTVAIIENLLRIFLLPVSVLMQLSNSHNQLIYVLKRSK